MMHCRIEGQDPVMPFAAPRHTDPQIAANSRRSRHAAPDGCAAGFPRQIAAVGGEGHDALAA
jgi:hypothetical protein